MKNMQDSKSQNIKTTKNLLQNDSKQSNIIAEVNKIYTTYISKHILPLTTKVEVSKTKIFTESNCDDEEKDICDQTNIKQKELTQKNSSKNSSSSDMSEHLSKLSFSISKSSDLDELIDNFSNKSDEKVEIEYKKTSYDESIEIMRKYNKENFKALKNTKKGFDEEVKLLTEDFYNELIMSRDPNKKPYIKKSISYIKVDTMSQAERMRKFKHDLTIKLKNRFRNARQINKQNNENDSIGKKSSMKSKSKRRESKLMVKTDNLEDEK